MSQSTDDAVAQGQVLLLTTDDHSYAFDLWEHFRISLGRHQANDIPLVSRKVSNYHAEILNDGDGWLLRDLGSTNGLFINDLQVRERRLNQGDCIRIGGHELTVHLKGRDGSNDAGRILAVGTHGRLAPVVGPTPEIAVEPGKGRLLSLAELLRLLGRESGTGFLEIENQGPAKGKVFIDAGKVVHSELNKVRGEKALYRLFRWREASFSVLEYPEPTRVPRSIEMPTEALVEQGVKQAGEWDRIARVLPPFVMTLCLREDCPLPLCELSPSEIEIFQNAIRHESIGQVLEESSMSDFRILTIIHALIQKKVLTVSESSGPLLGETFIHRPG